MPCVEYSIDQCRCGNPRSYSHAHPIIKTDFVHVAGCYFAQTAMRSEKTEALPKASEKGILFLSLSQFGLAFSINCLMSFLPFYIINISNFTPQITTLWIGLILGSSSLAAALSAPFWGSMTSRYRPKVLYERAFLCHGISFLLMGFTNNLYLLLLFRLLQGAFGGASTIGLFIITQSSADGKLRKDLGLFQNSMTAGQLAGPPIGAYAAALFGYQCPFILAFLLVGISLALCHRYVIDIPSKRLIESRGISWNRKLLIGWLLSLIATIHLTFLPSILPHILEGFNLLGATALSASGWIIMAYTAAAIVGNHVICNLSDKTDTKILIAVVCLSAVVFQVLLIFSTGVYSFAAIRMVQMGLIASVPPLLISLLAADAGGAALGFLNSARFAGNALGPLMATFIMAYSNLFTLYLVIAIATVGSSLPLLTSRRKIEIQ